MDISEASLSENDLSQSNNEEQDELIEEEEEVSNEEDINQNENENSIFKESMNTNSIEIAPTGETSELGNEFDPMLFIQLGDRIVIDSKKYGGRTIGTVYYRSLDLIRIKPDGVSNRLHDFELEQTEDEELFKEDDGVTSVYIIEKRIYESFVEQQDFRINQLIDTFDSNGDLYNTYKIIKVDKDNDYIKIHEIDDKDNEYDVEFNFIGIEPDEDFIMISIRQLVGLDEKVPSNNEVIASLEEKEQENQEDIEEEEDGIEVIGFIEVTKPKIFKEAATYEQRIPDSLQKIDALNDFITSLDPTLQKDPKAIRAVRILVEILFNLKQESILYNEDGSIKGAKQVSATTLTELINQTSIPLGRPVLNITKKLYNVSEEDELEENKSNDDFYFENIENEMEQMKANYSKLASSTVVGAQGGSIVRFWNDEQNFLKQYLSSWTSNGNVEPYWRAINDSEFFRKSPPVLEDNKLVPTIPGYIPSHSEKTPPIFDKIPFGIERALSATYRKGIDRRKQILLPEEGGVVNSYLLFPLKVANYLGTTRSYNLAVDSGRSQLQQKTITDIIKELGEPKEVGTSNDIILLDVHGSTLGNIPLSDYIEGLSMPSLGLGDTFFYLQQYGIENIELNQDILNVLNKKIELYQSQLLSTLSKLRKTLESREIKESEMNNLIENPEILEEIRSQPILVEELIEYEKLNPSLAKSDIGQIIYLLKNYSNYFQVTAGNNALLIAKAKLEAANDIYVNQLKINSIIKQNKLNAGIKPIKNKCKHVSDLVSIKKIFNDNERFEELTKFYRKYQGQRNNNWINCNICNEHLLCIHERLQLQAYLNPKEKSIIEKEIILKFAGGQFQGTYICRNCGQSIRELDFDNNIEFDDDGKPKSGRAVLVDEDALFEEKLDILVSVPIEESEKKQLDLNEDEIKCYNVIRELSERIGVYLDNEQYRNIISKSISKLNKLPSRDVYNAQKRALGAKGARLADYDIQLSRSLITICATFLLINIQCKIPSYVIRYTLVGCESPGFGGYPLDADEKNEQGIQYMACAISTMRKGGSIQTGFEQVIDDKTRLNSIVFYIKGHLKEILSDDELQANLAEKRRYLSEINGSQIEDYETRTKDIIPSSFLPEQIMITPEMAAENAIIPEIAMNMGNKGNLALIKLWIRKAHSLAKEHAFLVRGSPLSETTCCLTKINEPGTFWKKMNDLPQINKRTLIPNQQGHFLVTEFIPRSAEVAVAEPDRELYYRVFLKYCFQGPRMGYYHEPGLTNRCQWCGFQFPTNPSIMDTDSEGKIALHSQEVKTDTEQFTELLDTIHNVNNVMPIVPNKISAIKEIMEEFSSIEPAPLLDWNNIIIKTTDNFLSLPPNADKGDIAVASSIISEATNDSELIIQRRLKEQYLTILKDIANLSWVNFFQVLQSYFITPFQRLLSNYSTKSLFIPIELEKSLSEIHTTKDLQPIIDNELLILLKNDDIKNKKYDFARSKIQYFLKQLSSLLSFKNNIRPSVIPGKEFTLTYIQKALLYGPIATLINPDDIPSDLYISNPIKSVGDSSILLLLKILAFTLDKYNREKLSFNDQQIKDLIAIRDEKERVNVVKEFDKLSDEEKAVELMNKRLGLGKWAVGGTKLIYAYDKDYYDLERQKRLDAGIIDFPGLGGGEMDAPSGREYDESGFPIYDDSFFEKEGGYDHNQHADDDFE